MTNDTSNPFYDAWLSASEQLMKTQTSWFTSFVDASEDTASASEVVERAKKNWDQCEAQFNSWVSAADQWSSESYASNEGNNDSFEKLKRLLNPETFLRSGVDEINQVFKRFAEGPDFADIGVLEKKFMRTSQDWLDLRDASAEYQTIITKAWTQAFDLYVQEVSQYSNEDAVDTHEMMQLWLKIANNSLIQVQRSEEFLLAQRKLFKTNTQYKLKQREIIEAWCESLTMPTRTEVDDLHRMVYELRREVRQLKAQLKPQQKQTQSTTTSKPAKKISKKVAKKASKKAVKKVAKKTTKKAAAKTNTRATATKKNITKKTNKKSKKST